MTFIDCPVCHGTGCKCCYDGQIPYPWNLPEDGPVFTPWSTEEDAVVRGAPTCQTAIDVYFATFGHNRTETAIEWRYYHPRPPVTDFWSEDEQDILEDSPSAVNAVHRYRAEYGTRRTERAIKAKWYRLRRCEGVKT